MQSGSNRILKAMNRHYTAEKYLEIVNKLKKAVPGIVFSTDIIVGFPGETEEDFCATRDVMNEVGFDNAFIFNTPPDPVPYPPKQQTMYRRRKKNGAIRFCSPTWPNDLWLITVHL